MAVISIQRFGGMITNPEGEDIPDNMAEWARDTDPNYKGKLKGIPINGDEYVVTRTITNINNASPMVATTSAAHGLSDNMTVTISDVTSTLDPDPNGTHVVTVVDSTHFSFGMNWISGAYDSGGTVTMRINNAFESDWIKYEVSGASKWDLVYFDKDDDDVQVVEDFYAAEASRTLTNLGEPDDPPQSMKAFNNAVQIGLGNGSSYEPLAVYRLLSAKRTFDDKHDLGVADVFDAGLKLENGYLINNASGVDSVTGETSSWTAAAGYFQAGIMYGWGISLVYGGLQESGLQTFFDSDGAENSEFTMKIIAHEAYTTPEDYDSRITAIKIYRAESSDDTWQNLGLHRLVRTIDIDSDGTEDYSSGWVRDAATNHMTLNFTDTGGYPEGGATYEEETGIAETLENAYVHYGMNEVGGGYHWTANCYVPVPEASTADTDWNRYIFRSKKFRPNMVDWSKDFCILPEIPTAIAWYNNKLYAFSENNTYRIHPELMAIEDTFEGVGCTNAGAVTVTEFGMFFCNRQGCYRLANNTMDVISDDIRIDGDVTINVGWKSFAYDTLDDTTITNRLTRFITLYDANMRMVLFIGNSYVNPTATFTAFAFHLPTQSWRELTCSALSLDANSGAFTGKDGEIYFSGDDALTPLMTGATSAAFDWVSKIFHLNEPSQNKMWSKLKWDVGAGALTAVTYGVDGAKSINGSGGVAVANDTYINIYNKTFQVHVDGAAASEVDSLDIIVRPLIGKR